MNIYHVREKLRSCTIFDLELNVGYYARVSSDSIVQQTSIQHQDEYYRNFITNNKKWRLVGEYIDNGISGIRTEKREAFNRMISDAKSGKIDLIITKEITRFARNTLDSIKYTRELLSCGVCVWFQNDNINTIDEDSELRLTIMSGIAQDESRKLSNRIKFGHAQSIKNGVVLGCRIYGYTKKDGKLTIEPKSAAMVREVFEKYATGDWSTPMLEKYLYEKGYRNFKGGKINRGNIGLIIRNPKYKGYYCGGKVKIVDMFTKKQEFLPQDEWVMYKDENIPQIVDEKTWERANKVFEQRGNAIKGRHTSFKSEKNLFTNYIFCGDDGAPYWMKQHIVRGKEDISWVCSYRIKNGVKSCKSFLIHERELREMIADLLNQSGELEEAVKRYTEILASVVKKNDRTSEIVNLKERLERLRKKNDKLLDMNLDGLLPDNEYSEKSNEIRKQINETSAHISELESNAAENIDFSFDKILSILNNLSGILPEDINRKVLRSFLEKIIVNPKGEKKCEILFFLKDGDVKKKFLNYVDNTGCSETMFLNMFPERHIVFNRVCITKIGYTMPVEYNYRFVI